MKKNTKNRNNKQPCSQISCMAVFQSGINSPLQIESYAIVNEKNIFSFTISRYARSDRRERMCKAILIK